MSPWDRSRYPANWQGLRQAILERAGHRCEWCGLANHSWIYRDGQGRPHRIAGPDGVPNPEEDRPIRIILTMAHLDHDVTHNDPANLRALCQKCHLTHDAKYHAGRARITRAKRRGQLFLFPEVGR